MDQANSRPTLVACPVSPSLALARSLINLPTDVRERQAPPACQSAEAQKWAAVCWRHNDERHLQSSATRDGQKTDGKKMEDMTQVQLSTAQRAPSDIPSGPNDDACCCRIAKDEGQCGGGMRVPQHWRCQGWLGGAVVGCTRRWRRTRRPHAAESPARRTADPVPSSKRRRPPRTLQASFLSKTSGRHVCCAPIPSSASSPFPPLRPSSDL